MSIFQLYHFNKISDGQQFHKYQPKEYNHLSPQIIEGPLWSWSYGSWIYGIYNYPCNQCLLLFTLWVRTPFSQCVFDTTLYVIKFVSDSCQVGVFRRVHNKTYRHDITEILFKVELNIITITLTTQIIDNKKKIPLYKISISTY